MDEVRATVVRLIKLLLIGSLIPPIALLVLAYFSERLRKLLLAIMFPLAAVSLLVFFILAPLHPQTPEDWVKAGAVLRNTLAGLAPLLVLLGILALLGYLFGPGLYRRGEARLRASTRRAYLEALLDWVKPQLAGTVVLEGRDLKAIQGSARVTGGPGLGKTVMMKHLLARLAQEAAADPARPLPLWIDLDVLLAKPGGALLDPLADALPVQVRWLEWLLKREGASGRLVFLMDGSAQSFSKTIAACGDQESTVDLARFVETHATFRFVISMPPGVENGTLLHLIDQEVVIRPLSSAEIRTFTQQATPNVAGQLVQVVLADEGAWRGLAARPFFLPILSRYITRKGRLPQDIRELFRETVYPPPLSAEAVEGLLVRLARQALQEQHYWQPRKGIEAQPPKARGITGLDALIKAGLVRESALTEANAPEAGQVAFAHPIYLAYGVALAWLSDPQMQIPVDRSAGLSADPVLADALIFFNSIAADPRQLSAMLAGMVAQQHAQPGDRFGSYLAAQSLLALPAAARPADLVERIAIGILGELAQDETAADQARALMEPLNEQARLRIYQQALIGMDRPRLEQNLARVFQIFPDDLRQLLWSGNEELSRLVGWVWSECEPQETTGHLLEMYRAGPPERRTLALELLGKLPEGAVEKPLYELFHQEKEPALRSAILRSLVASGADSTPTLLEVVADPREADDVRGCAAELLAHSTSMDLRSSPMLREIVRINHLPLPERAGRYMQRLLDDLRQLIPDGGELAVTEHPLDRWERVVNPYVIGRPVTDPQMLVGLDALLLQLRAAVESASPVLVTGERGSGKTSLLLRFAGLLEEEARQGIPVRAAYLDVTGLQPSEFFETLIRAAIDQIHDPALVADSEIPRPYHVGPFSRDLNDLLEYLGGSLGTNARLVMLLDNLDHLDAFPLPMREGLGSVLRGAAARGLAVIAARSAPVSEEADPGAFDRDYLHLPVMRLSKEDALRLITGPVSGTFFYEPEAVERILQAAQGRPAEIQRLCQRVIAGLLDRGERMVSAVDVQAVLAAGRPPRAELLSQVDGILGGMMDWLEANPNAANAQVEEQLKRAWNDLQRSMITQVNRARKK